MELRKKLWLLYLPYLLTISNCCYIIIKKTNRFSYWIYSWKLSRLQ
jgi:hypothetical protein